MDLSNFTPTQLEVREAVLKICANFPDSYWAERDATETFPDELHAALARDGWIGIALPEELGGAGLGIAEATAMMQAIAESGAGMQGAQSLHANVYATQPVARFGTDDQRRHFLPPLIAGDWRTCFGVTEPNTGLDTLKLRTTAIRADPNSNSNSNGNGGEAEGEYVVNGQKIWITGAQGAQKMVLLARTTPLEEVRKPSEGLSLFFIDLDKSPRSGLELRKIRKMGGRGVDANEVFFDNYRIPAGSRVGAEGQGFAIVLHGMNAERCLLAGEALGLGYAALRRASEYARDRVVFGRPIGSNQGIQHPLAHAYMQLEAAKLATYHAAALYDRAAAADRATRESTAKGSSPDGQGQTAADTGTSPLPSSPPPTPPTREAVGLACNSAKYLAAEAAFFACERSVLAMGGMGYAAEFHVERYLRDSFVPRLAPVSGEMIKNYVAEKALGLPRSY